MERITTFRANFFLVLVAVLMGIFALRLYDLQIIRTDGNTDNVSTFTTRTTVKAARGDITDTNGNILVSNRASYDLVINHYVLESAEGTNQHLYNLVKTCQAQGIEYNESFPISQERPFVYTLSEYSSSQQSYFQAYLAYMGDLDSDITAPLLIEKLRERYKIPATWTEEEARLVIGLWYELDLRGCVSSLPLYIFITDVDDNTLSAVKELTIPGLNVEASTVREYNTAYAAHILGYVGPMNAKQWEYYKNIEGYNMDAEIGQDGLEAEFEDQLHGIDGLREDTVASDGTLISSRYLKEPQKGNNVEISIDINLQMIAEDEMAKQFAYLRSENNSGDGKDAEGGAVVVLDVKTGEVLVCASYPTYDLSTYSENYNEIVNADFAPLFNRALQGNYPPGSTYKMSSVIAGINSGAISSTTEIYDKGAYRLSKDFSINCLQYTNTGTTHGSINAAVALQKSCNYFFYELSSMMHVSSMDNVAKGLGLGEPTGVELYEEIGHRANPDTKRELYTGDDIYWSPADQALAAIGQSDNLFSPMQLAVYTATLANQGLRYKATFLNRVVSADYRSLVMKNEPTLMSKLEISQEAYLAYSEGMQMVASVSGGTAYSTFKNYPIAVAAKTGTAQTGILTSSDNAAFVCYAPADDPQIAIAIYGEKAGHGSSMAGIAKAILDNYFEVGEIGDVETLENQLS